jgi:hypothetical protein
MDMLDRLANAVNASYPLILRGTNQQTDNGLLWVPPAYTHILGPAGSNKSIERCGIRLGHFELHNRSGGVINCGIGFRLANRFCGGGRLSADGVTFTALPTLFSLTANTVQVAGADQTGFVVYATVPFGWVSARVTTAETDNDGGAETDHTAAYWNGTAWSTIASAGTFADGFTKTGAVWALGETNFVWQPAADWAKTQGVSTIPNGVYAMRFTSADREALDVAAIITGIELGTGLFVEALADNGIFENEIVNYTQVEADALVAFFSTASGLSRAYAEVEGC